MAPTKSIAVWLREWISRIDGNSIYTTDGKVIFCEACQQKVINLFFKQHLMRQQAPATQFFQLNQHNSTEKHKANVERREKKTDKENIGLKKEKALLLCTDAALYMRKAAKQLKKSSTCPQHLLHHSPRRVNMQTQTEVSSIAFSNQTTGFGSRITRTFSVIGGVAGSSGGNEERGLKGSPVGKKENKLKEAPEDVLNEPEGRGEIVSEMLAGTIRGLAQTVSRTATSGIKSKELKGTTYSLKQKREKEDDSTSSPEFGWGQLSTAG
uniref:Uncharacterized protein n=1 Tax=Meloidogyne javanica TaxID=6303 RepID=A0A915LMA7_MELJA